MRIPVKLLIAPLALCVGVAAAQPPPAPSDTAAVEAVLASYKTSLERLDLTGVEDLFAEDNQVIESGKVEGRYTDYLANHIGPELDHFQSFAFSDYKVDVNVMESVAWATETYRYTIRLKDKADVIERQGVASTVLNKHDGQWKIVSTHSSSRVPRKPAVAPES